MEAREAIEKALANITTKTGNSFALKEEQAAAILSLLKGQDVLAVLPTGFGKSMVFTVYGQAQKEMVADDRPVTVLIISPLKSYAGFLFCVRKVCILSQNTEEILAD